MPLAASPSATVTVAVAATAAAVDAPRSVAPANIAPVATVVALSSMITYTLLVPSVDVILKLSFSTMPLAASPSATVIVAVAKLPASSAPVSDVVLNASPVATAVVLLSTIT